MVRVAITGGPGSGKSTVRSIFEGLGAHAIDLDHLSREAVGPETVAFREIVAHFGYDILIRDGTLDRAKLRKRILGDPVAKEALERITHPAILGLMEQRMEEMASQFPHAMIVVEVPLLAEAGLQDKFDVVILVVADWKVRKERIVKRDGCLDSEARALMGLHLTDREKGAHAHFIIENSGTINDTKTRVTPIFDKIIRGDPKILT